MKSASLLAVSVIAVGLVSHSLAQETAKKTKVTRPAPGPSDALLVQWNEIGRKLIAMAEGFPEAKYDFKPAGGTRSFAERLIHAAAANYFFTNLALGQKPPAEEDPPRTQFSNKGALVTYVRKSFADGAAAIKAKGDKGILESVLDPFAQDNPENAGKDQIRLMDLAHSLVEHSGEVYGQLTVYYRAAGMIPPESRPKKTAEDIKPTLPGGKVRTYYIAAIETNWDYASGGINMMTGAGFAGKATIWTEHNKNRIGTVYRKALFREYTDDTFATEKKRAPEWEHLGIMGPLIRAEVGDTIVVHFMNKATQPYSIHPHGVAYDRDSEVRPILIQVWTALGWFHQGKRIPSCGTCRSAPDRVTMMPVPSSGSITLTIGNPGTSILA